LATGQLSTTGANMAWDSINNRLGIGTTAPGNKLSVLGENPLYLGGVKATSTFTADSILTIYAGVVKKAPYSSLPGGGTGWLTTGNSGIAASNFLGTIDNINLRFRTNNIERMVIDNTGKVGIGITAPPNALSVLATNPLYLSGVQATSTFNTDSILTIKAGVVKKAPYSSLPSGGGGSGWLLVGNSDANASSFLGPTDPNVPLVFQVGGLQAGYLGISSSGITTLGVGATAASQQSTSIGTGAKATGQNSTALGAGASAGSQQSTALGTGATASDQASLAIGYNAKVTSQNAIAIGSTASTSVTGGVALGYGATASSQNGVAIGSNAGATTSPNTLALGTGTKATGQNSIAVGNNASAPNIGSEAFGNSAAATGANSMVVGNNTTASGNGAISIGDQSTAAGTNSIVLGNNSSVAAVNNSIVLGTNSTVLSNANNTILIGDNLSTSQSNVLILGNSSKTVGISTTTPNAAAKLDVNGPFKLGVNGSVIDNIIKTTITVDSAIIISKNGTTNLTIPAAVVKLGATVIVNPRARNRVTRALPNTVAIGYAYVSALNIVTIDFITNDNGNATIPAGTIFDITIIQ
jgi:Head domain of trimeric autotransporter adhesin